MQPSVALVPAAKTALARRVSYRVVGFCVLVLCLPGVAIGYAGAATLAGLAMVALVLGKRAIRSHEARPWLERHAKRRAQRRREVERLELLQPAGLVREEQYLELRRLLDQFVRLAVSHRRCAEAIRLTEGSGFVTPIVGDQPRSEQRREIRARRTRHREQCIQELGRLADQLETVQDLVRLIVQRIAYPVTGSDDLEHEIQARLAELDEVDTAMAQLDDGQRLSA